MVSRGLVPLMSGDSSRAARKGLLACAQGYRHFCNIISSLRRICGMGMGCGVQAPGSHRLAPMHVGMETAGAVASFRVGGGISCLLNLHCKKVQVGIGQRTRMPLCAWLYVTSSIWGAYGIMTVSKFVTLQKAIDWRWLHRVYAVEVPM